MGGCLTDSDDGRVVVLSYWLWQDWFNSDEKVIGKSYSFAGQNRRGDRHHEAGVPLPRRARRVLGAAGDSRRPGHAGRVRAAHGGAHEAGNGPRRARGAARTDRASGAAAAGRTRAVRADHGASPAGGEAASRATGGQDLDGTLDSARHGRHRLPRRVCQRGEPVHGQSGEPARRTVGAPGSRRWTRRPRASAGDRRAPSRGSRRRGWRGHRVGRRPTPGPRGA